MNPIFEEEIVMTKIFQGVLELILAVVVIMVFEKIMVMSWRGVKSGARKLKNHRRPVVVVES
jgi:hypothetical protein